MKGTAFLAAIGLASAAVVERRQASSSTSSAPRPSGTSSAVAATSSGASSSSVPQYFQTSPELFAGPTPTGVPAFLAQTNPAPFPGQSYIAPQPLETQVPIRDQPEGGNIYHMHGQLSHYFPNPIGFGVDEYHLPQGANISQLYMLSRHGSRYPTSTSTFAQKIVNNTGKFTATGELSFLNSWTNKLGEQILTPVGKQELFDSGVLHQYSYGHLYPNNGSKIVARSTTEDRMVQSAEYFLAGFFGLQWPKNASLELIIEETGYNNSLAGYDACPMSNTGASTGGTNASNQWISIYLADAYSRLKPQLNSSAVNLTIADVYSMQSLCAYETVALGYSAFCNLFSWEEWEGYEYSVDLSFAGNNAFQSPTGRAVGIGWAQELIARMTHHYINSPSGTQVNTTLDSMPSTFPLNQALNFDFSHDTNIMSDLTALGMTQFAKFLPPTYMVERELIVSHLEPFGARLDIEIIQTPTPVSNTNVTQLNSTGSPTMYVHFILNQRTIPLHANYKQCKYMANGWCEMSAFLNATSNIVAESQFQYSCFGNYSTTPYGTVTNGVPVRSNSTH